MSRTPPRNVNLFEAAIIGPAVDISNQLDERDRREVRRLIALIELDPRIDGSHKVMISVEDIHFTVYNNGIWQIAYSVVDNAFIQVTGIARVGPSGGTHLRL